MPPDVNEAYTLYENGRALMQAGDLAGAISCFRTSISVAPHYKSFELLGECLIKRGSYEDAASTLAQAILHGNQPARSHFLLAQALLKTDRRSEARANLDVAIQLNPNYRAAIALRQHLGEL